MKRVGALRSAGDNEAGALGKEIDSELKALDTVEKGLGEKDDATKAEIVKLRGEGQALAATIADARKALAEGKDEASLEAIGKRLTETRAAVTEYRTRAGKLTEAALSTQKFVESKAALVTSLEERQVLDTWGGVLDGLLAASVEGLDPKNEDEKTRLDEVQVVRDTLAGERKAFTDAVAAATALEAPEKLVEVTEVTGTAARALDTHVTTLRDAQWAARTASLARGAKNLEPMSARIDEKMTWWQASGHATAAKEQKLLEKEKKGAELRIRSMRSFLEQAVPETPAEWEKHVAAADAMIKDGDGDLRRINWLLRKEPVDENKAALDSMDGDLRAIDKKVKKRISSLQSKAAAWKKAGDAARSDEIGAMVEELQGILKTVGDARKVVKEGDLSIAKAVYNPLHSQYKGAMNKTAPVVKEKVVKAGGAEDVEDPGGKTDGGKTDGGKTDGGKTDGGKTDGGKADAQAALKAINCSGGMKRMIVKNPDAKKDKKAPSHVGFCIDYYEYPGKGAKPKTNVSWQAARAACASQGKRLCSNWEWRRGCGSKYSYGKTYDPERCNTVDEEGMERPILPAGSKPQCRSGHGLYDMIGNVAEWTEEKTVNGGDSYKTAEDATCWRSAKRFGASKNVGFRCCADLK